MRQTILTNAIEVLAEDYGTCYYPERQNGLLAGTEGDGFFVASA